MSIINTLIMIASNIFFCLYITLMHMGVVNFIKKAAKEKDEEEKRLLKSVRNAMSFFLFLGIIAYSSYIKFIIQIYINK